MFTITIFGAEPYGNYNRILLSGVLAGTEDEAGIFLNSLPWYAEHDVRLHPVAGSPGSTGPARSCTPTTGRSPRTTRW